MDLARHRDQVEPYLLGELSGETREEFERHLFDCETCAEEVKAGSKLIETVQGWPRKRTMEFAATLTEPQSDGGGGVRRQRRERLGKWVGRLAWAAVPCLGVLLLYQQMVVVPGLRAQLSEGPSAGVLTATLLRPSTRGAALPLRVQGRAQELYVQLDLPPLPTEATLLICVFDRTNQPRMPCFEAAIPEANEPLLVRIDAHGLPAGSYLLRVAPKLPAGQGQAQVATYPFQLVRP